MRLISPLRPITVAVLLCVSSLLALANQQSDPLRKAQEAAQKGNWPLVQKLTAGDHGTGAEAGALYLLHAYSAMQQQNYSQAATSAQRSIDASPTLLQAWLIRSESLFLAKNAPEGLSVLEECVRRYPDSARATFALGVAYARMDRCNEAITPLEETMFRRPDNQAVVSQLAQCYAKTDRFSEACDLYGRLVDVSPADMQYRLAFAECLMRQERYDSVIAVLSPAERAYPNDPTVLTALGFAYQQQQRFDEAVVRLKRVTEINPTDANAFYNYGSAAYNSGDPTTAVHSFKTAVKMQPNLGQAWFNMALAYSDQGFVDEAVRAFRRAAVLLPQQASDCYTSIAVIDRKLGNIDAAMQAHDRAIALALDEVKPYASKGHTYVESDQWEEGRQFLEGALERFPNDPELLYPLAKCYLRIGDLQKAEAIADDLDKRMPLYGSELRMMMRR